MRHYTAADGLTLKETGTAMVKKPNPVYLVKQDDEFSVETNEGVLTGKAGDFLAHDPISGHVWPVAASYVEQHYEKQRTFPLQRAYVIVTDGEEKIDGKEVPAPIRALGVDIVEMQRAMQHVPANLNPRLVPYEGRWGFCPQPDGTLVLGGEMKPTTLDNYDATEIAADILKPE